MRRPIEATPEIVSQLNFSSPTEILIAVTLGGVIWQWQTKPLQTSALKSQIADYHPNRQAVEPGQSTTTVASIPQSASNASPPAPEQQRGATKYTPQDAQEMTKALRKFHPIINGKLLPAIDSALHLVNAWDARMDISAIAGDPDRVFRFRMGALRETAEGLLEFQKMPMPRSQKQERYTRNLNRIAAT